MIPFQEFCKIVLPSKAARQERIHFNIPTEPPVYIAGIEEQINILPSLQKPRKVTLKGNPFKIILSSFPFNCFGKGLVLLYNIYTDICYT